VQQFNKIFDWSRANGVDSVLGFAKDLEKRLYGQHIAIKVVSRMIPGHLKNPSKKPLAISIHGLTGIGKSYITQITTENLFKLGMKSKYYHDWSGAREFEKSHLRDHYMVSNRSSQKTYRM